MSALADKCLAVLKRAEADAEQHMAQLRHDLRATDADVVDACTDALRDYVSARRQYVEAKRIAEWNASQSKEASR